MVTKKTKQNVVLISTEACAAYLPAESPAKRRGSRYPVVRTRKKKKKKEKKSDNNTTTPVVDDTAVLVAQAKEKALFPDVSIDVEQKNQ